MPRKSKLFTPTTSDAATATEVRADVLIVHADDPRLTDEMRAAGIDHITELPADELAELGDMLNAAGARLAEELGLDDNGREPALKVVPIAQPARAVPEHDSDFWNRRITALDADIAAMGVRLAELQAESAIIEDALDAGAEGAEAEDSRNEESQLATERRILKLKKSRTRADAGLAAAQRRAAEVRQLERRGRVAELAAELNTHAAAFDMALVALGAAAEAIKTDAIRLGGYSDLTHVSQFNLLSPSRFSTAVHHASPALASLLHLERDGPLSRMRPLAETMARIFHSFLTGEMAPVAPGLFSPRAIEHAEREHVERVEPVERGTLAEHVEHVERVEPVERVEHYEPLPAAPHGLSVLLEITAGGRVYHEGEVIPADVVATWRPHNVAALIRGLRVQPLPAPALMA